MSDPLLPQNEETTNPLFGLPEHATTKICLFWIICLSIEDDAVLSRSDLYQFTGNYTDHENASVEEIADMFFEYFQFPEFSLEERIQLAALLSTPDNPLTKEHCVEFFATGGHYRIPVTYSNKEKTDLLDKVGQGFYNAIEQLDSSLQNTLKLSHSASHHDSDSTEIASHLPTPNEKDPSIPEIGRI